MTQIKYIKGKHGLLTAITPKQKAKIMLDTPEKTKTRDRDFWLLWVLGILAAAIGWSFSLLHTEISEVRTEMHVDFGKVNDRIDTVNDKISALHTEMFAMHTEIGAMHTEMGAMHTEMGAMRTEMGAMQATLNQILANSSVKKAK